MAIKNPAFCGAFWGYIQRLFTFKFFHFFLLGFAVDAFGSDRSGQQSFFGNRSAAGFAHAVCSVVDSFNGFLHFDNEFALTVADAQLKITVGFQRGAIIGIRKFSLPLVISETVLPASLSSSLIFWVSSLRNASSFSGFKVVCFSNDATPLQCSVEMMPFYLMVLCL